MEGLFLLAFASSLVKTNAMCHFIAIGSAIVTTFVLALEIATLIIITIAIHIVTPSPHLGLNLHGRPVGLNKAPPTGHVNCVPSVSPTVVHKLLRRLVLLRLGDQKSILTDTLPLTRLPCRSP